MTSEAQKFPHRWKLSWPGNCCLDCGEDDPFEACVTAPGECVCLATGAGSPTITGRPPGCKVVITPCPATAFAAVRTAAANDAVRLADNSVLSRLAAQKRRFLGALKDVMGLEVDFISDLSAMCDFMPDATDTAEMSAMLGVPVHHDDLIVDILQRMKKNEAS